MSLSLSVGDLSLLSLAGAKDLVNSAKAVQFKLGHEFEQFFSQPLSAVPPNQSSTNVQYAGDSSWIVGAASASPLTFALGAGGGGKISIITSGDLFPYTDSLPEVVSTSEGKAVPATTKPGKISAGSGQAYVGVELMFQVSGGLTGALQQGIYGVSTADSASSTITVSFYKSCPPSTTVQDALKLAFEGFLLPLHEKTLESMEAGDYLHYNFKGNLQLGVGASIGYDRVFYAANTAQALAGTAGMVAVTQSPSQEVRAGAVLSFGYDYAGSFEALLWREANGPAHVHLYRSAEQDVTVGGGVGMTMTSSTAASVSVTTDKLTTLLTQSMPDALRSTMTSRVLPAAMGEINNYVGELTDKVAAWLSKVDQQASLDAAITKTSARFLLTDYTIDLSNPSYAGAWKLMLQGKFLDAIQTPGAGVTLDTGSGMEALFNRAASIKLNLFGAFHAAWTDTTLKDSSLVYAGNNIFHLVTVEGRDVLDVRQKTQEEVTIYFATEADLSTGGSPVGPPQLHCLLQATNNSGFAKKLGEVAARLSSDLASGALPGQIASVAGRPGGKVTLHMIFPPEVYGQLTASTIKNGKPDNELPDELNFAQFHNACAMLYSDGAAQFLWNDHPLLYPLWRNAWIASNDQWPAAPGSVPDRRENAGYGPSVQVMLDESLPGLNGDAGQGNMIFYAMEAAAQFMNFCEDLHALASTTAVYTTSTWQQFADELERMVKNLNTDFLPATALALATRCGGTPQTVAAPLAGLPTGSSLGVTITFGKSP